MNSETNLIFSCHHCRTSLSVPVALAGVTGPCPQCGNQITAPLAPAPVAVMPTHLAPLATLPVAPSNAAPIRPQTLDYIDAPSTAESIRPEPRGITPRTNGDPSVPAPIIDTSRVKTAQPTEPQISLDTRSQGVTGRSFLRIAIPVLILGLLAFGFYQLTEFLKSNSLTQPKITTTDPKLKSHLETPIASPTLPKPVITTPTTPKNTIQEPVVPANPILPNPTPITPIKVVPINPPIAPIEPPTTPIESPTAPVEPVVEVPVVEEPQAGVAASRVVEQFLAATSFNQRMMYVQTRHSPETLQNSMLAYKWPTAHFMPGSQIPHPTERLTEFYYEVRFGENSVGFPSEATLLVHKRADEEPKVILEPLLDTIGGRLRDFAKEPSSSPQDFYVIMDARIKCFDDTIPSADNKSTFYLRAHMTGKDIATAYTNKDASILEAFNNPLTGLKWKNPMPVIVTLQWNTSVSNRPYLEVIQFKSFSWNPQ